MFMNVLSASDMINFPVRSRTALFTDILSVIEFDQFSEVNKLTPALPKHEKAIPESLRKKYVYAMMSQSESAAHSGAPAAKNALLTMDSEIAEIALTYIDEDFLGWRRDNFFRSFLETHRESWPTDKVELFNDYTTLGDRDFRMKYDED
jgi:hypothetical protein